jgi:hypothetical protein
MWWVYADALYVDAGATVDDLREAVTMLEEAARTARRVFSGAHPLTTEIEGDLQKSRAALGDRETRLRNFASFLRPNGHEYL